MTLKKLKALNKLIKYAPLCELIGMNVETMKARIKRGTPELTDDESEKIRIVIQRELDKFRPNWKRHKP